MAVWPRCAVGGRPDSFQEVRLAHAGGAVNQQRRDPSGVLRDHLGGDEGQAVALSGDERREGGEVSPPGGKRFAVARRVAGGRLRGFFLGRVNQRGQSHFRADALRPCPKIGTVPRRRGRRAALRQGVVHDVRHARAVAQRFQAGTFDLAAEIRADPVAEEAVGHSHGQGALVQAEPRAGAEPQLESFLADLVGQRSTQGRHDFHIVPGHFHSPRRTLCPRRPNHCGRKYRALVSEKNAEKKSAGFDGEGPVSESVRRYRSRAVLVPYVSVTRPPDCSVASVAVKGGWASGGENFFPRAPSRPNQRKMRPRRAGP